MLLLGFLNLVCGFLDMYWYKELDSYIYLALGSFSLLCAASCFVNYKRFR